MNKNQTILSLALALVILLANFSFAKPKNRSRPVLQEKARVEKSDMFPQEQKADPFRPQSEEDLKKERERPPTNNKPQKPDKIEKIGKPKPVFPNFKPKSGKPTENSPNQHNDKPVEIKPKPPIERPKPPTEKPLPPTEKPKPPIERPKPPTERLNPPTERPKPPVERPKPPTERTKPPTEKPKPPTEKPKPPIERLNPPVERPKPPTERPKPPIERAKPPIERPKPPIERPKPPIERPRSPHVSQPGRFTDHFRRDSGNRQWNNHDDRRPVRRYRGSSFFYPHFPRYYYDSWFLIQENTTFTRVQLPEQLRSRVVCGNLLEFELEENPDTAYQWMASYDAWYSRIDIIHPPKEDKSFLQRLFSSPGKARIQIEALNPGTTMVEFFYIRPWEFERGDIPAKRIQLFLDIAP